VSWRSPTNAERQKKLQTEANWGQTVERQLASSTGLLRTDRCLVKPPARKSCYILKQMRRWYDNIKTNPITKGGQVWTWFTLPTILTNCWLLLRWQWTSSVINGMAVLRQLRDSVCQGLSFTASSSCKVIVPFFHLN
jgi:hypothetical protein